MNKQDALLLLQRLRDQGHAILAPQFIDALTVILEQDGPPAPQTAPPTTAAAPERDGRTGFVGVFLCPYGFWLSEDQERWIPYEDRHPALAWSRLLSFGGPGMVRPHRDDQSWVQAFIDTTLAGQWTVDPIRDPDTIRLTLSRDVFLTIPAKDDFVREVQLAGQPQWEFKRGANIYDFMTMLAHAAVAEGIAPDRDVLINNGSVVEVSIEVQSRAFDPVPVDIDSIEDYIAWTERLAAQIYAISGRRLVRNVPMTYDELDDATKECWRFWVRNHPGMLRLELALRGFFENGGEQATVALSPEIEAKPEEHPRWLSTIFEGVSLSQILAPGLGRPWQQAIQAFAAEANVHAILEAPRYLFSAPPERQFVSPQDRWMLDDTGYEGCLTASGSMAQEEAIETATAGVGVGPWIVVNNPLAMGSYDPIRLAPPSGHVAGAGSTRISGVKGMASAIPEGVDGVQIIEIAE
ncbi:MAG: hypothetical protein AAFV53_36160 [Myxococcota bacterium]